MAAVSNRGSQNTGALSELTVLDLSHHVAGAYCGKLLAAFGADVSASNAALDSPLMKGFKPPPLWCPSTTGGGRNSIGRS